MMASRYHNVDRVAMMISTRYDRAMNTSDQIRALINRLARLNAAETWEANLNPAQIAALGYLSRANRFSRAPSHVAEYLGTTRGTMSQTLKALERKSYVNERRSETDKRSIVYDLTDTGIVVVAHKCGLLRAIDDLPAEERDQVRRGLSEILMARLTANGGRSFGICKNCAYHRSNDDGAYCALLSLPLAPEEREQICHEQVPA